MDHGIGRALLKTSPAGVLRHPIEAYLCIFGVEGISPGIYHYSVKNHELELIEEVRENFREKVVYMCADQPHTGLPAVTLIYTGMLERKAWKYKTPRAYRTLMMDLGHVSQTFYLVSSWLGLGVFFTGALREENVEQVLSLDPDSEIVLGASGIGRLTNKVKSAGLGGRFIREDLNSQFNQ